MVWVRHTSIFQVTTAPTNLDRAVPHTGGWTESIWCADDVGDEEALRRYRLARRALLPRQAKIIGSRKQNFNLVNGALIPGGAASTGSDFPGNSSYSTDLPQVSLQTVLSNPAYVNTSRQMLRCIPDDQMSFGEFQPSSAFLRLLNTYLGSLRSTNFYFPGRDLDQPKARVLAIAGAAVTVDAVPAGTVADSFVRLLFVKSDTGLPLIGRFRVANVAGNIITLTVAPGGTVTKANGFLRRDVLGFFYIVTSGYTRARVKKIGRPSEGYRGRRSKARA